MDQGGAIWHKLALSKYLSMSYANFEFCKNLFIKELNTFFGKSMLCAKSCHDKNLTA